jgi:hypothetical protein
MNERPDDDCELLESLTDSFVAQYRLGQRPSVEQYAARHPEQAEQLREILAAIVLLERHAAVCDSNGHANGAPGDVRPTPEEIGDFTIVREIGRGGMGIVYEAVQQSLGRHVALKVLSMPTLVSAKHLERFRFEARAAARLQHPHIVPVFGVGELDGLHYYAMQYIHGQSLLEVVAALRSMDGSGSDCASADGASNLATTSSAGREFYRNVARIGLQVAEALAYAHGVQAWPIRIRNRQRSAKRSRWSKPIWRTPISSTRPRRTTSRCRSRPSIGRHSRRSKRSSVSGPSGGSL